MTRRHRDAALVAVGIAGLATLLLAVDPRAAARAAGRAGPRSLPLLASLSLLYYVVQGLRWQPLLAAAGVRLRTVTTVLLNLAGQAAGLLPAGEVARVALVGAVTGAPFATVLATVAVQELTYTVVLVALAMPAAWHHAALGLTLAAALAGTLAVILLLAVPAVWRPVRRAVGAIPPLRRAGPALDVLQRDAGELLRRSDTFAWSVLTVAGAVDAVTLFWLVTHLLAPGALGWTTAALVYAVAHVAAALSGVPGGLGVYEASVTGLLVATGIDPATAAACAVLHRLVDKGLATAVGVVALGVAHRRVRRAPALGRAFEAPPV